MLEKKVIILQLYQENKSPVLSIYRDVCDHCYRLTIELALLLLSYGTSLPPISLFASDSYTSALVYPFVIVQVLLSPAFISPEQSAENVPPSNSTPGGVTGATSVTSYCPASSVTTVP